MFEQVRVRNKTDSDLRIPHQDGSTRLLQRIPPASKTTQELLLASGESGEGPRDAISYR